MGGVGCGGDGWGVGGVGCDGDGWGVGGVGCGWRARLGKGKQETNHLSRTVLGPHLLANRPVEAASGYQPSAFHRKGINKYHTKGKSKLLAERQILMTKVLSKVGTRYFASAILPGSVHCTRAHTASIDNAHRALFLPTCCIRHVRAHDCHRATLLLAK